MRHVAHLVAVAEADDRREVVLDDAEVIAVVRDVGRQQQRVPSAEDALLAQVGRAPIDFVHQLVGLHDLRRLGESLADLGEEGDVAVRDGLVVPEAGVGELLRAARRRALDERARARRRSTPGRLAVARRERPPSNQQAATAAASKRCIFERSPASHAGQARAIALSSTMSFDAFRARARARSRRAGVARLPARHRHAGDGVRQAARGPFAFLLESAPAGGETWARYTFLGSAPRSAWRLRDGVVEDWTPERGWHGARRPADPLADLDALVRAIVRWRCRSSATSGAAPSASSATTSCG